MILTIGNQKGGVCKTTIATILAAGLSGRHKKTLLVDLDPQCSLTYSTIGKSDVKANAGHLMDGTAAETLIQHTEHFGDIITGTLNLSMIDNMLQALPQKERCYVLKKALEPIAGKYDYIIIDTPPAFGTLTVNALTASDEVIIPAMADGYSIQALQAFIQTVKRLRDSLNPALNINGIIFNRFQSTTLFAKDISAAMQRQIAEPEGIYVYNAKIREAVALKEAAFFRQDIFSYAPKSKQADDCAAFIDEFIQRSKQRSKLS